ncbi:MAG: aminotransferase class V-fold PLP-dependent enzyme [Phycisphaerales bacterium JB050]
MPTAPPLSPTISDALQRLDAGPLTEDSLKEAIWPLFSRVLNRPVHPKLRDRPEIYLANHSLGRPLDQTAQDIQRAMDRWYTDMDSAWTGTDGWMAEIEHFRSLVAKLIGAARPDCIVPKTSAGQGLRAVLNALSDHGRVPNVVATRGEFDSCDFILKTYHAKGRAKVKWVEPSTTHPIAQFDAADVINAIDDSTDLVLCSQVLFSTGQVMEGLPDITAAAHRHGAFMVVDTYHSAGVMPISIDGTQAGGLGGADFAIGGNYKYTRGGPGACWLAVHPRHLNDPSDAQHDSDQLSTLDTGWFAKKNTFSYQRPDNPELSSGGDAWLESTPPIMTAYQARAGLELTLGIGVERLREYNLRQQTLMREAFKKRDISLFTPAHPQACGGFALLVHDNATALSNRLREEGVNTDSRGGCVRFGPDLLNTVEEFELAAEITARVLG